MPLNELMNKKLAIEFMTKAIKQHKGKKIYFSNMLSGTVKAPSKKKNSCYQISMGVSARLFEEKLRESIAPLMRCKAIFVLLPHDEDINKELLKKEK